MQLSHTAASSDMSGTVRPVTLCDNLGSHAVTPVTPGLCSDTCDTAGHPVTPHSGFPACPPLGPLPVPTLCLGTDPTGGRHPVPLGKGGTCHLQDICSLPDQPRAGCWEGGTGEGVLQGGDALGRGVRGDRGLQEGGRWGRGGGGGQREGAAGGGAAGVSLSVTRAWQPQRHRSGRQFAAVKYLACAGPARRSHSPR